MFCPKCGKPNDDNNTKCSVCGANLPKSARVRKLSHPSKSRVKIAVIGGFALIAALAIFFILSSKPASEKIASALNAGDYQGALSIYQSNMADTAVNDVVYTYFSNAYEKNKKDFVQDVITFDQVESFFNHARNLGATIGIEQKYQEMVSLKHQKDSWEKAQDAYAAKDYALTLDALEMLGSSELYAKDVEALYKNAKTNLKTSLMQSAAEKSSQGDFDAALDLLNTHKNLFFDDTDYANAIENANDAKQAQAIQQQIADAEKSFAANQQGAALQQLSDLKYRYPEELSVDHKLEELKQKLLQSALAKAQAKAFSEALLLLEKNAHYFDDSPEYQQALISVTTSQAEYRIAQQIAEAKTKFYNNQREQALQQLFDLRTESPQVLALTEAISSLENDYTSEIIAGSKDYYQKGNAKAAYEEIDRALKFYPDHEQLNQFKAAYLSYIPVPIADMELLAASDDSSGWGSNILRNKSLIDNYGNAHQTSFCLKAGRAIIASKYAYQTLSGTIATPKGYDSDWARTSALLEIYGDDKLIYSSEKMNNTIPPEPFSVDISKYDQIKFRWICEGSNIWGNWGYFATIFDGVMTPVPLPLPG